MVGLFDELYHLVFVFYHRSSFIYVEGIIILRLRLKMEEGNEIVKEQGQKNNEAEIYLLVGFFGAGKTSLIRRVLTDPHGEKFAVIQNEFA